MDAVSKLIDRFMNMVPPKVQRLIRLGALLAWVGLAIVLVVISWQKGVDSAPELGQDLSHANIKAKIERENNLRKQGDVVLPDLNDLLREEHAGSHPAEQAPPRQVQQNPLVGEDARPLDGPNPVPSYETRDRAPGTVYQGDGLQPLAPGGYTPRTDAGAGGVRSQPAPGQSNQNLRGLDGRPLDLNLEPQSSRDPAENTASNAAARSLQAERQSPPPAGRTRSGASAATSRPAQGASNPDASGVDVPYIQD